MTKEEYYDALKSPQWIEKRNRIKKRDGYTCVKCKSKKELHVHHTYYLQKLFKNAPFTWCFSRGMN